MNAGIRATRVSYLQVSETVLSVMHTTSLPIAPTSAPAWVSRIQVLLLGLTSVVLSLASGWTTWLGMTNFTQEAVLSLMITFGIQGVMMVLSWVLGTRIANARAISAAAKASHVPNPTSRTMRLVEWLLISSIILVALNLIAQYFGLFDLLKLGRPMIPSSVMMFTGISLALLTILVVIPHGPELIRNMVQAFVSGTKHIVVMTMLAACLLASVFFSFDSLFSRILPDEERRRIADFRSRSVVMDIRSTLQAVTTDEHTARQKAFFGSSTWSHYNSQLNEITSALQTVPQTIDLQLARDQEKNRQVLSERSSRERQIGLERRRIEQNRRALQDELKTARENAAAQRATMTGLSGRIAQLQRQIAVKAAEIDAEENGLGTSRRKGRGPAYRKLADEAALLQSRLLRLNAELEVLKSQRNKLTQTIANLQGKIASRINAEQQLINKVDAPTGAPGPQDKVAQLDARKTRILSQITELRSARRQFEADPSASTLGALKARCVGSLDLLNSGRAQSALKTNPSCDINELRIGAAPLFALKAGLGKLATDCRIQEPQSSTGFETDVALARECIVKSGLLPALTAPITAKLDRLERERDDKAHRFVVSMNAFLDGNKLAFLAAGIALAIDLLVLVSGLLGALAIRPQSLNIRIPDEDSRKNLDDDHLQDLGRVLRLALGPRSPRENAKRVLQYIEPAKLGAGVVLKVETANVALEDRAIVQQFLNAGTAFAQVYSTEISEAAVGIDRELYLATLKLADQKTKLHEHQEDAKIQPAVPSSLRERLSPPKTVFTKAGRTEASVASRANPATTTPDNPTSGMTTSGKAAPSPRPLTEPEISTQSAADPSSVDDPNDPPRKASAQPTNTSHDKDKTEDQIVTVTDGSFNFDQSRR